MVKKKTKKGKVHESSTTRLKAARQQTRQMKQLLELTQEGLKDVSTELALRTYQLKVVSEELLRLKGEISNDQSGLPGVAPTDVQQNDGDHQA
jgi:hypothetical protein